MDADLRVFIDRLTTRGGLGASTTPLPQEVEPGARQVFPGDDLRSRFVQAAEAAGARVTQAARAGWSDVVLGALRDAGSRSVAVDEASLAAFSRSETGKLRIALANEGMTLVDPLDREALFATDVSVTGVRWAIAESGSLVCQSGASLARGATLLPDVHVAVIHETQLIPDLCDALARLSVEAALPAAVTIITGPSKTADIEGTLVQGMHGPRVVLIVLVSGERRGDQ
jgi:L-lactate dehydrogenase complex protein LldG